MKIIPSSKNSNSSFDKNLRGMLGKQTVEIRKTVRERKRCLKKKKLNAECEQKIQHSPSDLYLKLLIEEKNHVYPSKIKKSRSKCGKPAMYSNFDKDLTIILHRNKETENAAMSFMLMKRSLKKKSLNAQDKQSVQHSPNDLYIKLLNEEKDYIYSKVYEKMENKILEVNTSKKKRTENSPKLHTINKNKLDNFLSLLKEKKQLNRYQKKCINNSNFPRNPLWITPIYIIKAINESLLNRKWNNLTELLLILLTFPPLRYKAIIRHVSLIFSYNILICFSSKIWSTISFISTHNRSHI